LPAGRRCLLQAGIASHADGGGVPAHDGIRGSEKTVGRLWRFMENLVMT